MRRTKAEKSTARYTELKVILEERRQELLGEVKENRREALVEIATRNDQRTIDPAETSEADIQDDMKFALIAMKADNVRKIDEALAKLEQKTYGNCSECKAEITAHRLRALPFAARCKNCAEARELEAQHERQLASRRSAAGFMLDFS